MSKNFTFDHRLVRTIAIRADGSEDVTYDIHEVVFYEDGEIVVDDGPISLSDDTEKGVKKQVGWLVKAFKKDTIVRRGRYEEGEFVPEWTLIDVRLSKYDSEDLRGLPTVE